MTTPAEPTASRLRTTNLPASVCLTALSAMTALSLCRVFSDWDYLQPMLVLVLALHGASAVLRALRVRGWIAMPLLAALLVALIGVLYYRSTLAFGFPTGTTIDMARVDARLVLQQFASAVAPVPSHGSFATATAAALGVCAILADAFAFRAQGRVEPVVPCGVIFVFAAALGTDRQRILLTVAWIGVALLTIAVLRFGQTAGEGTWMGSRAFTLWAALPAIVTTVAVSAVAAAAIAPHLPGAGEKALIDTRNRDGSVTEVLSPLVDIRARMRNRGNSELFTVQSSDGPHYWRAISLPQFDGEVWSPAAEDLVELGDRSNEVALGGRSSAQLYTIKALRGHLVPAAYRAAKVSPDVVVWAAGSESLVLPDQELQKDDRVAVVSVIAEPTVELLRQATVSQAPDNSFYLVPANLPDTAVVAAREVTAGATTPYDQMMALQNWFRTNFTYDLDVPLGNSNDAIAAFLRDRRGFCQQFAGTFAVMARTLGVPARIAVGYTPGDLGNDGLYHVFGRHAHAWPEVWFDGIGWVAFEPTPGRGSPDSQSYTGLAPQQDDSHGSGARPSTGTTPTTTVTTRPGDPAASTTVPGGGRPGDGSTTGTTLPPPATSRDTGGSALVPLSILGALALLGLWMAGAPRAIAWWLTRRRRATHERVVVSWKRACNALMLAGAPQPRGATPLEYAEMSEQATGIDHRTIRELAVQVTRAVYAPATVTEGAASRSETLGAEIDTMCRARTAWLVRLRGMVDPRMMRRRLGA
jgi:transglutaminase-like putative cysteine protease